MLTQKLSSVTIFRNGTIRYVARMHAIVACQMDFQLYPMDIQVCPMYIESCKYQTENLKIGASCLLISAKTARLSLVPTRTACLRLARYKMSHL